MPGTYVYHFDNMAGASKATMRHFKGLTIRTAKVFDKEVPKTFPEFDPPATKCVLKACNEEIHPATKLKGNEEIRNEFLMNWLNIHYSDCH